MNWFTLTIISVITLSVATLLQKILIKEDKSDPIAYSIVFQLMCAVLVAIFAINKGFTLPAVKNLAPYFILEAVLYAGSIVFFFKALKTTEVSQVTILSATSAFWAIVGGILFLGESFSLVKVVGSIIIFGSVVLASGKNFKISFGKSNIYILVSSFCFGLGLVNDRFILQSSDPLSYLAIAFFLPGIFLAIISPRSLQKVKVFFNRRKLINMFLLAVFYSISALATYLAFKAGGNASQVVPVTKSQIILTVILAAIFLGERDDLLRKLVGAFTVIVGVLMLR